MQTNDSLVLCLHCWGGFGWQRIAVVNSSSNIDRCDIDDRGNALMTITTVAMTVVAGCFQSASTEDFPRQALAMIGE